MKPTLSHRLNLWTEAEMAGGATKAELAKALTAKGAELDKGAKPAETPPAPSKPGEGDKK
ncbi:MAG: hypothetical protein K2X91_04090 [Thermoleophilia bacterium]|nr:hypothetical protein [Thermoleophilia bacterium]